MLTKQKSLYELFADYDEERLLRIVTVDRAMYRPEALVAAEQVLVGRGVSPPTFFPAPVPSPVQVNGKGQPAKPYQLLDFIVDAMLVSFLYLVTSEMDVGSVLPESWLADAAVRLLFISCTTLGVMYLRQAWRTKSW